MRYNGLLPTPHHSSLNPWLLRNIRLLADESIACGANRYQPLNALRGKLQLADGLGHQMGHFGTYPFHKRLVQSTVPNPQ